VVSRPVITFLTDFGVADDFVGTCRGVIKRLAPDAEIIDITHGIAPQQVLQGALVLANTLPYMPEGVHLAVVDPGVGRPQALALRSADGRLHVAPTTGCCAGWRLGGIAEAWSWPIRIPSGACLVDVPRAISSLRPRTSPAGALELGRRWIRVVSASTCGGGHLAGRIVAHVLIVDRFGNVSST
jgi:S-adenosylmethionine hydrolase